MNKNNYIDYPSDKEIENEINLIITKGLPNKVSFLEKMYEIYRNIGIKNLFNDRVEILLVLVIMIITGSYYLTQPLVNRFPNYLYSIVFIVSPIFYMVICTLSFGKNQQAKTIDIIMSCKYTIYHLSAFKMLIVSIVSVVLNSLIILLASLAYSEISFLNLFLLSVSSLFLFALGFLFILIHTNRIISCYIFSGSWLLINILASSRYHQVYSKILSIIPILLHLLIIALLLIGFIRNLKKLTYMQMELL